MTRNLLRAGAFSCALLTSTALSTTAYAQSTLPTFRNVDANGVDLTHGDSVLTFTDAVIGTGRGALSLARIAGNGSGSPYVWDRISFQRSMEGGVITVTIGHAVTVERFTSSDGVNFTSQLQNGSTLTKSSGTTYLTFTRRDADGTTFSYGAPAFVFGKSETYCRNDMLNSETCQLVPLSIQAPDGGTINLEWDTFGNALGEFPNQTYEHGHRLSTVSNSYGYKTVFAYQSDDANDAGYAIKASAELRNENATQPVIGTISYTAPDASTTLVTDLAGRTWRIGGIWEVGSIRAPGQTSDSINVTRGTNGMVTSVTNQGVTTNYSRSVSGSTATMTVTDANNQQTVIVSNLTTGRPTSVTDPLNRATSYQYDSSGRLTRVTAPEGNYTQYSYDARGNVTEVRRVAKAGSGLAEIVTSATFASSCSNPATCNKPMSATDARGNVTDYTYDSTHGGVLTVTGPAPSSGADRPQVRYSYTLVNGEYLVTGVSACASGTASTCVGTANESRSAIGYDANGNVTSSEQRDGTGALSAVSSATYTAAGDVASVDGPLSGTADTIRFRYNAGRQRVGAISADPDGSGSLQHRAVRTTYGSNGLPTKTEVGTVAGTGDSDWAAYSPAQAQEVEYDSHLRPVVQRLTSGSTTYALTQASYDSLGRPRCSAQRMNPSEFATSALPSDACTLDTEGTFGPDRISRTTYDAASQVTKVETALNVSGVAADEVTATYRGNGQVETVKDGENNLTTYVYDGHDRLSRTRMPSATQGAGTSSTTDYEELSYDAGGNVTNRRLRDGNSIAFTLDALNRVTAKNLPGSEPDVTYSYDLLGRMTGASTSAQTLGFTFDALGRNLTQVGPQGTVSAAYDIAGRRTRLTYPGSGLYIDYDYLVTGETTHVRENGASSGVGVLATFAYDDLGRRTSLTRGNGNVTSYDYDPASRLDELVQNLSGTSSDLTLGFTHNPSGQIVSNARSNDSYAFTGLANANVSDTHNGLNQVAATGSTSLSHDSRGNTTAIGSASYGYTSENLMTNGPGSTLSYDPLLRLHQVAGSTTTRFAYDGLAMIAEYDDSNTLQRRHVHGPSIDELLVTYEGTGTSDRRFLHADERGSIIAQSDSSGALTGGINRYDDYGNPQGGSISGRFGYTGQAWLPGLNLWYYKARMYNGSRFMQTDPIGYGAGMNLYPYVGGDPVNFRDPSGLDEDEITTVVTGPSRCQRNMSCLRPDDPLLRRFFDGGPRTSFFAGLGGGGAAGQPDPAPIEGETIVVTGRRRHAQLIPFTPENAYSHYMWGRGEPICLTRSQFARMRSAARVVSGSPRSEPDGEGTYTQQVTFYGTNYGFSLGVSTGTFDATGRMIGLKDDWDLDPRYGERGLGAEIATRVSGGVADIVTLGSAQQFEVYYPC